ncbi:MAG TPA: DNA repair protein RadC [Candidatus Hungatella pullicola]|nr:DNA repair protein RadC [Candidatus Hungatella pullicola]
MAKITMKDIPQADRPYEKCLRSGPGSLSDEELLAIIIRTGSREQSALELSRQLLTEESQGGGLLKLLHLSLPQLMQIKGIGKVKGAQLLCIGELSRRIWRRAVLEEVVSFTNPEEIVNYYMEDLRHMEQEQTRLMLLNTKGALIKELMLSQGTVNMSLASPREIFLEALRHRAVYVVMVHNHPSGDPSPSREDILLTKRVREAGELIGIPLLDHVIIGDNSYISLKERGII